MIRTLCSHVHFIPRYPGILDGERNFSLGPVDLGRIDMAQPGTESGGTASLGLLGRTHVAARQYMPVCFDYCSVGADEGYDLPPGDRWHSGAVGELYSAHGDFR